MASDPLQSVTGFFGGGSLLAVQVLTLNIAPGSQQIPYVGTANAMTGLLWGVSSTKGGLLVGPLGAIPKLSELFPVASGIPASPILSDLLRVLILPSLWLTKKYSFRPMPDTGENRGLKEHQEF